jgi:hypothetical protein
MFVGGDGASCPDIDGDLYVLTLPSADETDWRHVPVGYGMYLAAMHLLGNPVSAARVVDAMREPSFRAAAVEFLRERIELH